MTLYALFSVKISLVNDQMGTTIERFSRSFSCKKAEERLPSDFIETKLYSKLGMRQKQTKKKERNTRSAVRFHRGC